ncbi:hypothetical protein L1987_04794 [Smallanthus sonchifolius]|uniref:Uncharacterized protein n=1 Tax=Smallanthus sonchifolius TaxID=185202 RepID=A0ACB9JTK7_9ASTR|nr:hypothetical protein L1987_04794 [Smallanthus sonchifolius]
MYATDDSTTPPLFRRNSIGATTKHCHPSSFATTTSSLEFELVAIKPTCYTSLRDILPSPETAFQFPKAPYSAANPCYEILIRNCLVKQAAWAYLQPMSTSLESSRSTVFYRLWTQFSGALFRLIATAFDCLLWAVHVKRSQNCKIPNMDSL